MRRHRCLFIVSMLLAAAFGASASLAQEHPEPQYRLTQEQTHNRFSSAIPPGLRVPSDSPTDRSRIHFEDGQTRARFSDNISIPIEPFPGVLGVAPATEEMLSTIPPRANGGNLDDPHIVEGTSRA